MKLHEPGSGGFSPFSTTVKIAFTFEQSEDAFFFVVVECNSFVVVSPQHRVCNYGNRICMRNSL